MKVRLAMADDSNALAWLHASAFVQGWTALSMAELLAAPGTFALLAEDDGRPEAFILIRAAGGEAEILTLAVRPDARRRGLGRGLVLAAAAKVHAMQAETLFLEVAVDNVPALRLYELLGFARVGRRKAYYACESGPLGDALTLKVDLPLAS